MCGYHSSLTEKAECMIQSYGINDYGRKQEQSQSSSSYSSSGFSNYQ